MQVVRRTSEGRHEILGAFQGNESRFLPGMQLVIREPWERRARQDAKVRTARFPVIEIADGYSRWPAVEVRDGHPVEWLPGWQACRAVPEQHPASQAHAQELVAKLREATTVERVRELQAEYFFNASYVPGGQDAFLAAFRKLAQANG